MAKTAETKPDLVTYSVEAGKVFRTYKEDKLHVADYDPKTGLVKMHDRAYRVPVIRHLNDKGLKYEGLEEDKTPIAKDAPKKPKKNPRIGDKTPEVVKWYARYQPEAFKARYGVRELQIRTGWNEWTEEIRNDEGHLVPIQRREPIYETVEGLDYNVNSLMDGSQRLIADRETCITVKMRDGVDSEEEDWSLDD